MSEKIVNFQGLAFHGECCITLASLLDIGDLPGGARRVKRDEHDRLLVAHSESGHHHYVLDEGVELYETSNPLIKFLKVELGAQALLRHLKPAGDQHRHDTQRIPPGLYRISLQREHTPQGWKKTED